MHFLLRVLCGLLTTLAVQQVQNKWVRECEGHAGLNVEREVITALNAAHLLSRSVTIFQRNPPTTCIRLILTRFTNSLLDNNGALEFPFPR